MTRRMGLAVLALCGMLLAAYLALHDLGYIGTLACGSGSCELVQTSKWATFLGIKVAVWGVGYYLLLFAVAVAGTHEGLVDDRRVPAVLLGLTAWGCCSPGGSPTPSCSSFMPFAAGAWVRPRSWSYCSCWRCLTIAPPRAQ